jgi:hypothetical protein
LPAELRRSEHDDLFDDAGLPKNDGAVGADFSKTDLVGAA